MGAPSIAWETTERLSKFHYVPLFEVVNFETLLKDALSAETIIGPEEDRPVVFNSFRTGPLPDIAYMPKHGFLYLPGSNPRSWIWNQRPVISTRWA